MSGGFRRSSAFGIVGVIVVMVAVALIALQFGSGTAHPTGALIAIVGIVFGFIAILMVLQRRESRSKRWKGMDLEAGGDGITVERRRDSSGFDWLCDLWLAERLADAVRA